MSVAGSYKENLAGNIELQGFSVCVSVHVYESGSSESFECDCHVSVCEGL